MASGALAQGQHLTAREVVARIQQQVGVPWQSDTVDTFKAGNPDSPVSGVAVTLMATLDVLQRAAAGERGISFGQERRVSLSMNCPLFSLPHKYQLT